MRHQQKAIPIAALVCALALAGCGGISDPAARAAKIKITSPAIHGISLPALYTCDGKDVPPPLEWGPVPSRTGSLVLLVLGIVPKPHTNRYTLSIVWALAGIDPNLHRLDPGRLPRTVSVGIASDGKRNYSICPKRGTAVQYQFELYAVPAGTTVSRGFAALPILATLELHNPSSPTVAYGALVTTYKRK